MEITVARSLRHWWVFVLRGVVFIILGIYVFTSPASAYLALGFMFGLVILLAGISELIHAYQDKGSANRGWHLFVGLVDLIIGLILLNHLAASMDVLRVVIGVYFLFRGLSIFNFRGFARRPVWILAGAIIVLLFGIMVIANPVFGAATVVIWTGAAFIVTGILNIMLGLRMKPIEQRHQL
ncbi:MAG TPA: DUF308 domain-containing protein [Mucilaginibacter sp.]